MERSSELKQPSRKACWAVGTYKIETSTISRWTRKNGNDETRRAPCVVEKIEGVREREKRGRDIEHEFQSHEEERTTAKLEGTKKKKTIINPERATKTKNRNLYSRIKVGTTWHVLCLEKSERALKKGVPGGT